MNNIVFCETILTFKKIDSFRTFLSNILLSTDNYMMEAIRKYNRERAKKYYDANKGKIAEQRKIRRQERNDMLKQCKGMTVEKTTEVAPVETPKVVKKKFKIKITPNQSLSLVLCNQYFDNNMTYSSGDKPLQPSTVLKYKKNIKQFFLLTGENDLRPYLNNPEKIYEIINNAKLSIASKVDITVSILKLLNNNIVPNYPKAKYDLIDGYFRKFKAESDAHRKNKITDEKHAIENFDSLAKIIKDKYGVNSKENIIIGLYAQIPKRDDFYLKITDATPKSKNENYIVVPKKGTVEVIINQHKTGEKYTAENEKLSSSLSNEIRAYIAKNNLKVGDYLFTNKKLGPFIKAMFAKVGKPEINGPTALRHSIITTTLNKPDLTVEEANQLAKTMKHSTNLQQLYKRVEKK